MTDAKGRGVYSDPTGARAVLEALGGVLARPDNPAPRAYRGRCNNGYHAEVRRGKHVVEEGVAGCSGETAEGYNPMGLCVKCIEKQRAATSVHTQKEAGLGRYVPMPGLCHHGQRRGECGACLDHR